MKSRRTQLHPGAVRVVAAVVKELQADMDTTTSRDFDYGGTEIQEVLDAIKAEILSSTKPVEAKE